MVKFSLRGQLHWALSLQPRPDVELWRECVFDEIIERLVLLDGDPPTEAVEYHNLMVTAFTSCEGSASIEAKTLLRVLPNGEWRNYTDVEYYIGYAPGSTKDPTVIAHTLASGLTTALADKSPHVRNNAHWTGAEIATDHASLPLLCHNIGEGAYKRYCVRKGDNVIDLPGRKGGLAALQLEILDAIDEKKVEDEAGAGPDTSTDPRAVELRDLRKEKEEKERRNARDRQVAMSFLQSRPQGLLYVQRLLMEVIRAGQSKNFWIHSEEFELQEQAKAAEAIQSGASDWVVRDFAPLAVARGDLTSDSFHKWHDLFRPAYWAQLNDDCCTVEFRAHLFAMLSRLICVLVELVDEDEKLLPDALFPVFDDPEKTKALLDSTPRCLWDDWTLELVEDNPDYDTERFRGRVFTRICTERRDNSISEASFAGIRRNLVARSVQCKRLDFHDLNFEWMSGNVRTGGGVAHKAKRVRKQVLKPKSKCTRLLLRPRRCGGLWRCYVRERKTEDPGASMGTISADYYALPATEMARLVRIGRLATLHGRNKKSRWTSSFGLTVNKARSEAVRAQQRAWAEDMINMNPQERRDAAQRRFAGAGDTVDAHVAIARSVSSFGSMNKISRGEETHRRD